MNQYYYVGTFLPELKIGVKPDISFEGFMELLKLNLSPKDLQEAQVLRTLFDIENLRHFWRGEPIDPRGTYDEKGIEEAILTKKIFPAYVNDFLDDFPEKADRLHHFSRLWAHYFKDEIDNNKGFLRKFLKLQRDTRIIMAAFRAKKFGRDLFQELQYEDPNDPLVQQILAQRDAKTYEPPQEYADLKTIFQEYSEDPEALFHAYLGYQFKKVEEMIGLNTFNMDKILGYMAQLVLVERSIERSQERGLEKLNQIVKEKK